MEDSPKTDPEKAGKTNEQTAANAPKSGQRTDQGAAPAPDHYRRPETQAGQDQTPIPAPDVAGAKYQHAILAQPPEALTGLTLGAPYKIAAGVTAVLKSAQFSWGEDGVVRGTRGLLKMNQTDGFDCSSCAWPDPDHHRSVAEFCEKRRQSPGLRRRRARRRPRFLRPAQPGRAVAPHRPRPEQRRPPHPPAREASRRHPLRAYRVG